MTDQKPPIDESEELARAVSAVRIGLRGLYRSGLPRMAAALAYRTIFSVIPVLVISLVIASSLISPDQVRESFSKMLEFAGLETIVVTREEALPPEQEGPPAFETRIEVAPDDDGVVDVPARSEQSMEAIDELLTGLVDRVTSSLGAINKGWIGFISAGVFIYAALSLFLEIERSFNQIYRVQRGRGWMNRLLLYWTMLSLGSILLLATFSVGQRFTDWVEALLGDSTGSGITLGLAGYGVTVLISTLLLWIIYNTVPNVRVAARPSLLGAFMAAVVWELGKWGFTQYVEFSTGYARFYGSLALLPLFLLWVYVTWLIVLFGLQITYTLQNWSDLREPSTDANRAPAVLDPAMILMVASAIAARFERGHSAGPGEIGGELDVENDVVERMCDALAAAGVIHRLDDEEDGERYTMAAPPSTVSARDILERGLRLGAGGKARVLSELDTARLDALGDRSLADLIPSVALGQARAAPSENPSAEAAASPAPGETAPS